MENSAEIKNYIVEFENQLQNSGPHMPFRFRIERSSFDAHNFQGSYLEWDQCDQSQQWKLFYRQSKQAHLEFIESRRSLVESDLETRAKCAMKLDDFLAAYQSEVQSLKADHKATPLQQDRSAVQSPAELALS